MRRTAAALCIALAAAPATAGEMTDIPTDAVNDLAGFWGDVMVHFYGPYDRSMRCWTGTIDGARQCMRPHRLDTVEKDGHTRHFIVAGGYPINADGGQDECHACSGSLGMIVLQDANARMELVARNSLAEAAGAWGEVPGEDMFRLREIGEGAHGWTMETGWTGQGYTLGQTVVYGLSGSDVVELGSIPDHADNGGTCGDGMGACFVKSYDVVFDPGSGGDRYDIVLKKRPESTEGPGSFRIPFDADALTYTIPEEVETFFQ